METLRSAATTQTATADGAGLTADYTLLLQFISLLDQPLKFFSLLSDPVRVSIFVLSA